VLQRDAVCSVLQCVAGDRGDSTSFSSSLNTPAPPSTSRFVLQRVIVCCSMSQDIVVCCSVLQWVAVGCSALQCVAVCCSVLQCVLQERGSKIMSPQLVLLVLQCVAVCCSVLQCVAVCCSVLQCVAVCSLCVLGGSQVA